MHRAVVITVVALAVGLSGCGGTEESDRAVSTTATAVEETTTTGSDAAPGTEAGEGAAERGEPTAAGDPEVVEVVECTALDGPVNLAVQSVGCTVDGAPAPVSALPCDDGRTVLIAGNRYGIEGETWQPYDLATGPPVSELC